MTSQHTTAKNEAIEYPNNYGPCPLCKNMTCSLYMDNDDEVVECNDCTFDALRDDYDKWKHAIEHTRQEKAEYANLANDAIKKLEVLGIKLDARSLRQRFDAIAQNALSTKENENGAD
jgi:Zn ribbon nucleic-acid-binding protein